MAHAEVDGSFVFDRLGGDVGEVRVGLSEAFRALNAAFDAAREKWKDRNADVCAAAISAHNDSMRAALEKLSDLETFLHRLGDLAEQYENI